MPARGIFCLFPTLLKENTMKLFTALALLLSAICATCAQDATSALTTTSISNDARFEIIQTPWDKAVTFRIDKYRGVIDRLATCTKDDSYGSNKCWKEMIVVDLPKPNAIARAHFQIVINAPAKNIFLLDTDTGTSWQFGLDPTEKWFPFVECSDKTNSACLWRPLP